MDLVDAVEERLHKRNPKFVHRRFHVGRCPYCNWRANLDAVVAAKVRSHKAVPPS